MFSQCFKDKLLLNGSPVLIPQKQREKVSPYGLKLTPNFCRLQILKLADFSIKEQETQLP